MLPIKQHQANDAQQILGIYLAPDGNNKTQLQILLSKTKAWVDKVQTGHLNKVAVEFYDSLEGVLCSPSDNANSNPM